jgi:hemoglobin
MATRSPRSEEPKRPSGADPVLSGLYESVGGMSMCDRVSERFHARIANDPLLRAMFPANLAAVTDHLALFLAERLGGPAGYTAARGKKSLLCRHAHLPIGTPEVERWREHMGAAMEEIGLPEPARQTLAAYFAETSRTLSDPLLPLYHLPLEELGMRLEREPALATTRDLGRTLLIEAAGRWDYPRVQLLLEFGADIKVRDRLGHDALYRAANVQSPGPTNEGRAVVDLLVRLGADVDGRSVIGQMTPLHMAARRGTIAIAEALLNAGAAVEARDSNGETPLRRAVNCCQSNMVRLLLAHGADPLSRDTHGRTPLDAARREPIRHALQAACESVHNSGS